MPFLILLIFVFPIFAADVLVTLYPFYDVTRELAGSRLKVDFLVDPKRDYHLYELKPSDVLKVKRARIVLVGGVPIAPWEKQVTSLAGKKAVPLYSDGGDPHIWLSPKAMMKVAEEIHRVLVEIDPTGERVFNKNLKEVLGKLERLHEGYQTLKRCRIKKLVTLHPAFGWLAKDYGLKQVALASHDLHGDTALRGLRSVSEKLKVKHLIVPLSYRGKLVDFFRERGFKVFFVNVKIAPVGREKDYFSIMEENLRVLKEALLCL